MLLEPLLKDRGTVSVYVCVVAMYLRMRGEDWDVAYTHSGGTSGDWLYQAAGTKHPDLV